MNNISSKDNFVENLRALALYWDLDVFVVSGYLIIQSVARCPTVEYISPAAHICMTFSQIKTAL